MCSSCVAVPGIARAWMIAAPTERFGMTLFNKKISRRTIVQAVLALPALSLFRKMPEPVADPDEIVEVNGWILKRRDLA